MAKFSGKIGFAIMVETKPGVWKEEIVTGKYTGDVLRNVNKMQPGEGVNDNFNLDNRLSIIADPFAYENFSVIRCVEWMGAWWKINSAEIIRPRLILTIGGVYNGPTTGTP